MISSLRIFVFCSFVIGASAFAYVDKTHECKNKDGLPNNTYKITNIEIAPGTTLPYVEATRYYRKVKGDPNSEVAVSRFRGFASVHQSQDDGDVLMVGQARLHFKDNVLLNCRN